MMLRAHWVLFAKDSTMMRKSMTEGHGYIGHSRYNGSISILNHDCSKENEERITFLKAEIGINDSWKHYGTVLSRHCAGGLAREQADTKASITRQTVIRGNREA